MRKVKRWRYYCDFCKKSGGSGHHMADHEERCTMNPNRYCSMCDFSDGGPESFSAMVALVKQSVYEFKDDFGYECLRFKGGLSEESVTKKLREMTSCPSCLLAAIRQGSEPYLFQEFDFKKERDEMFKEHNANEASYIAR